MPYSNNIYLNTYDIVTGSKTSSTTNGDYYYSEEHSQYLANLNAKKVSTPNAPEATKKTFWESTVGTGLTSIWNWATTNPQQAVNLIKGNKNVSNDPNDPLYLQNGGYLGANTQIPTESEEPNGGNNTVLLVLMGVGILVVLYLTMKKN